MRKIWILAVIIAIGVAVYLRQSADQPVEQTAEDTLSTALVSIVLPDSLSAQATTGKTIFEAKCAACHGLNAVGQAGVAPPLIHKIYEPSHHGDESFQRAVAMGVRQHHWPFGNMPMVEGLTRGDVAMIIAYIREVQRENGIN